MHSDFPPKGTVRKRQEKEELYSGKADRHYLTKVIKININS